MKHLLPTVAEAARHWQRVATAIWLAWMFVASASYLIHMFRNWFRGD